MSDPITTFFDSWHVVDTNARLRKIGAAVDKGILYRDPRTPEAIEGIDVLNEYIGMFSANAPGWSAKVVKSDTIGGVTRSTVAFSGPGPDGIEQVQLGQYFIEMADGLISRMTGFVGTGELQ